MAEAISVAGCVHWFVDVCLKHGQSLPRRTPCVLRWPVLRGIEPRWTVSPRPHPPHPPCRHLPAAWQHSAYMMNIPARLSFMLHLLPRLHGSLFPRSSVRSQQHRRSEEASRASVPAFSVVVCAVCQIMHAWEFGHSLLPSSRSCTANGRSIVRAATTDTVCSGAARRHRN